MRRGPHGADLTKRSTAANQSAFRREPQANGVQIALSSPVKQSESRMAKAVPDIILCVG
jgi:hypothetical protein